MTRRIAVVQHGDYREALQVIGSGRAEPYFGMAYSLDVLGKLLDPHPHLVISLDAPAYSERRGLGELVGLPRPKLPGRVPLTAVMLLWAGRIRRAVRAFRPTHVLLRGSGIVAESVLGDCRRRGCDTLVVFANYLPDQSPRARRLNRRLVKLLNQPFVYRVGNHKWPATESVVGIGLDPAKAVAWDWPGQRRPEDHAPKELPPPPFRIVYAGSVAEPKGVGDLIDAVSVLTSRGVPVRLSVLGTGPDIDALRRRAGRLPEGSVRFEGRLPNDEVFRRFREAALVAVPSRHEFSEGMPLTLTEALASRTPVVASDHPVMARAFRDGEGLRFFPASSPTALADVARAVLSDPEEYARLSLTTAAAFGRVDCSYLFGDLIASWERASPGPA